VSAARTRPETAGIEPRTIDAAAREAGFALGATAQPGGIMLAGFAGDSQAAFAAAAKAAGESGIAAQAMRCMTAVDGLCITIETAPGPQKEV
jgi:hypothetical protein